MLKTCCQILNKSLVPFVSTPKSVKCLFNVFLSHCLPLEAGVPGPLNPKNQCSGYLVLDPFVSSRIGKVFISSISLLVLEFPDAFLHLLLPQFRHIVANKETSQNPTNQQKPCVTPKRGFEICSAGSFHKVVLVFLCFYFASWKLKWLWLGFRNDVVD